MRQTLSRFFQNFLTCGLAGWCMEILFTALGSLRRRDMTLRGATSLWMFPIYGCAALLSPVCRLLRGCSVWARGFAYMGLIFSAEFFSGKLLSGRRLCPWDYSRSRWNIQSLIRLDFAPFWFCAGLMFERLLSGRQKAS